MLDHSGQFPAALIVLEFKQEIFRGDLARVSLRQVVDWIDNSAGIFFELKYADVIFYFCALLTPDLPQGFPQ